MSDNQLKLEEEVNMIMNNEEKLISDIILPPQSTFQPQKKKINNQLIKANSKQSPASTANANNNTNSNAKSQYNTKSKQQPLTTSKVICKVVHNPITTKQDNIKKLKSRHMKYNSTTEANNNTYLTERANAPLCNRVEQSIKRLNEQNKIREEKSKQLQEKYKNSSNGICSKTKKVSFKEAEKMKDNFIERLKKKEEEAKEKRERIELEKTQKEEQVLLHQQQNQKKEKTEIILNQINEMLEWNEKRKEKIELLKSIEDNEKEMMIKQSFKPKLCPNSKKIVKKYLNKSTENAFERLYNDDEKRHQKRAMLQTLCKPSFVPILNKKKSGIDSYDNKTISMNDYCDLTINADIEELLRNKLYQRKKNKAVEYEEGFIHNIHNVTHIANYSQTSKLARAESNNKSINSPSHLSKSEKKSIISRDSNDSDSFKSSKNISRDQSKSNSNSSEYSKSAFNSNSRRDSHKSSYSNASSYSEKSNKESLNSLNKSESPNIFNL